MAHILKAGTWIEKRKPLKGEFDLDQWLSSKGGSSYTFSNGITETLGTVKLGGDLISDTIVSGQSLYGMYFEALTDFYAFAESGIVLQMISGTGIGMTPDALSIGATMGSDEIQIAINPSSADSFVINDNRGIGIKYGLDYSANFTARSLVDKGYVDAAVSDNRLKENIENIGETTSKILQLRPVEFDFISNKKHEVGFIAQEVQQIFPDMVVSDDGECLKIKRFELIPYLVKTIQELEARIKVLESK